MNNKELLINQDTLGNPVYSISSLAYTMYIENRYYADLARGISNDWNDYNEEYLSSGEWGNATHSEYINNLEG